MHREGRSPLNPANHLDSGAHQMHPSGAHQFAELDPVHGAQDNARRKARRGEHEGSVRWLRTQQRAHRNLHSGRAAVRSIRQQRQAVGPAARAASTFSLAVPCRADK